MTNWVDNLFMTDISDPASGSTIDYAYDKVGAIYTYCPELRGFSFIPSTAEINPSYLEQWAGLVAMVDAIKQQ